MEDKLKSLQPLHLARRDTLLTHIGCVQHTDYNWVCSAWTQVSVLNMQDQRSIQPLLPLLLLLVLLARLSLLSAFPFSSSLDLDVTPRTTVFSKGEGHRTSSSRSDILTVSLPRGMWEVGGEDQREMHEATVLLELTGTGACWCCTNKKKLVSVVCPTEAAAPTHGNILYLSYFIIKHSNIHTSTYSTHFNIHWDLHFLMSVVNEGL